MALRPSPENHLNNLAVAYRESERYIKNGGDGITRVALGITIIECSKFMANSPSPWSVKGVAPEAREAAKIAARKAGMTVGAWLSQMISQTAADQLRSGGTSPSAQPQPQPQAQSGQPQYAPPPGQGYPPQNDPYGAPYPPQQPQQVHQPGAAPPPAPTIQAVFESIQRLSRRIEQSEQRTADTISPIADKVAELSQKIEASKETDGTSTAPVERAMQRIAERLDHIEDGKPDPLGPVHRPRETERRGLFSRFRRD